MESIQRVTPLALGGYNKVAKSTSIDQCVRDGDADQRRLPHQRHEGRQFDVASNNTLEKYFSKYFTTTKTYKTQSGPDAFFKEAVKFLLEIAYVHPKTYGIPKNRVGLIIATYEGTTVD